MIAVCITLLGNYFALHFVVNAERQNQLHSHQWKNHPL
jgi:hypothetical protein